MTRITATLLLLLSAAFAQQQANPPERTVPATDRSAFTFTGYDLNVTLDTDQRSMQVRGTVSLRNDAATPQSNLALQISSTLKWASVRYDGKPLAFTNTSISSDIDHTGNVNQAKATLSGPVQPNASLQIEVAYQGFIPLSAARLENIGAPGNIAQHSDWDVLGQSYSAFRGFGYVTWYPVSMDPVTLGQGNTAFHAIGDFKARNAGTLHVHLTLAPAKEGPQRKLLHSGHGPRTIEQGQS